MNNLNQYKNRFNQLMESTIGDVKPLIMEQNAITITNFALIPEVPDPSMVTTSDGKTYRGEKITACGKSGTLRGKSNSDIPEGVTIYLSYSNDKDLVCTINGCSLEDTDLYKRMDRCK